jgi:3D (Asp-Asp-Asp) domain-containing protein
MTMSDQPWNTVVCISTAEVTRLRREHRQYRLAARVGLALALTFAAVAGILVAYSNHQAFALSAMSHEYHITQRNYERSNAALAALARSHEEVLDAKQQINDVGERSWGRRFIVTKYTPSAGGINAYGDGKHTSTHWKADPKARIVAVDPALIPYGSWIWIEDLGWFQAQDCGGAIKGFRLDVMNANLKGSLDYGKQKRFAIVVPPKNDRDA